ncbi:GtrA family protein [Hufsiella ginkgonis]|uniref:GtrA/DPMS transmembrane domain-containing protein n=1 Tax=Hufsiella ginkgonis TaxID=2695274 RepID=A0A7K1XZ68_9SPHI|nr:GtrA family protein [Hufsiella ginkgonis]MXV16242.1 hypothetical protein [Hufsiella ginkgonis]
MKFLRSQLAAFAATIVDFLVSMLFHGVFGVSVITANISGNISGGITNFYLGRTWVFNEKNHTVHTQFLRYVLVWVGNLVLNTGGVFLMTNYGHVKFPISKIVVSLIIGFFYNYLLQNSFVFKSSEEEQEEEEEEEISQHINIKYK